MCERGDLSACINIPSYWGVTDGGSIDWGDHRGEGDADMDNFDSYKCEGCDEFFSDWKAAQEHVGVKVAA